MKNRKKYIIVIVISITTVLAVLFSMWAVNKYYNDKMLEEGEAELFDESMVASYPLLVSYAQSLYEQASMFEYNAQAASRYARDIDEFQEILSNLNRPYINRHRDWLMLDMEYKMFLTSIPCGRIESGSNLRKKERKAYNKISFAWQSHNGWDELDPDSLIHSCQDTKVAVSEAIRDLDRYRGKNTNIPEWRNITS